MATALAFWLAMVPRPTMVLVDIVEVVHVPPLTYANPVQAELFCPVPPLVLATIPVTLEAVPVTLIVQKPDAPTPVSEGTPRFVLAVEVLLRSDRLFATRRKLDDAAWKTGSVSV